MTNEEHTIRHLDVTSDAPTKLETSSQTGHIVRHRDFSNVTPNPETRHAAAREEVAAAPGQIGMWLRGGPTRQ